MAATRTTEGRTGGGPGPGTGDPAAPAAGARRLPAGYPAWAEELAQLYYSGTTNVFVLHGNVHDLVPCPGGEGEPEVVHMDVATFLATRVFGRWDVVLHHDLGRGLRPLPGSDAARLKEMVRRTADLGEPSTWPAAPDKVFPLLDRFLTRMLLGDARAAPDGVAVILEHAQYVLPAADLASLAYGHGARLVRLLAWAQDPYLKRQNVAFCLVADRLGEVDRRLVESPYVATLEVPLPSPEERARYARTAAGSGEEFARFSDFTPDELAAVASGLSLVDLNVVIAQARSGGTRVDARRFRELKKDLIERQAQGLLEFQEPSHSLDMVVGHEAAKERLRQDAALLLRGRLDLAPMGYLVCGAVGTGKTFLAECYAGSIGIPCVKLLNFRSKYVGETEGNLEHVLNVLRSLGPVVVIVDEADAALGTREASGDAGTSSRVFSMIAAQMGDTRYRGKILWMLLTSRPDLLPVDLKRQGRAEVHMPLFYPEGPAEFQAMFRAMAAKNRVKTEAGAFAVLSPGERGLSGSDIESVLLAANRLAWTEGRAEVTARDLETTLADFLPSAQGIERDAQELAAVLECTSLSFLPPAWREKVSTPGGRAAVQERLVALRQILER